jgi:hypothetical protein
MQPARLPTSFVARLLLTPIPARRAGCLCGVPIPSGNPAWSCMKNASESKLGPLSADARSNREGLSRRPLAPGPPTPRGPNDSDDNTT